MAKDAIFTPPFPDLVSYPGPGPGFPPYVQGIEFASAPQEVYFSGITPPGAYSPPTLHLIGFPAVGVLSIPPNPVFAAAIAYQVSDPVNGVDSIFGSPTSFVPITLASGFPGFFVFAPTANIKGSALLTPDGVITPSAHFILRVQRTDAIVGVPIALSDFLLQF
jgi:hypothetical protein